jgi:prepilin-type N-terminal cleavage/methylation domain-containing protein
MCTDISRYRPACRPAGGFTLIELLTVIAVIAILAGILFPVVGRVQENAKRAKTRVQFSQWGAAIEAFRMEYGFYPDFGRASSDSSEFPDGLIDAADESGRFVQALSGRKLDGTPLVATDPGVVVGNTKRIQFYTFGRDEISGSGRLQDAFAIDDPKIVVLMDKNVDGVVRIAGANQDYASAPTVLGTAPLNSDDFVRAGVIFYSSGAGRTATDIVKSWE